MNLFLKGNKAYIIAFWGSILSLGGIAIFYSQYAGGLYYPLACYVDFLYAIGMLILIGNIFVDGLGGSGKK